MRIASWLLAAALGSALVACGNDSGAPSGQSLYGTWQFTKFEYVSASDASTAVDLVAGGMTGTVVLNADAIYTATRNDPGIGTQTTTGTWSYSADTFTLKESGSIGDWTFDMVVGTDQLTLTGANAEYDFNGDDTAEPAKWNVTLKRP